MSQAVVADAGTAPNGWSGPIPAHTVESGAGETSVAQRGVTDYPEDSRPLKSGSTWSRLAGRWVRPASTTTYGARFAEAQVKQLTAGDKIKTRRMRENFWEFDPTHKLWIGCNHLPKIKGQDHAIWRRICVTPFTVLITQGERDPYLVSKLERELSGILNWALRGHAEWRETGLSPPRPVRVATDAYRAESDWLLRFLTDSGFRLTPGSGFAYTTALRSSLKQWGNTGGHPVGSKEFGAAMRAAGCEPSKVRGERVWTGVEPQIPTPSPELVGPLPREMDAMDGCSASSSEDESWWDDWNRGP